MVTSTDSGFRETRGGGEVWEDSREDSRDASRKEADEEEDPPGLGASRAAGRPGALAELPPREKNAVIFCQKEVGADLSGPPGLRSDEYLPP